MPSLFFHIFPVLADPLRDYFASMHSIILFFASNIISQNLDCFPCFKTLLRIKLTLKSVNLGHQPPLPALCASEISKEASVPLSKSLMNTLNNTGPSTEPWGTSLMTSLQLVPVPLIIMTLTMYFKH